MSFSCQTCDAIVIGGGFYGSVIALYLARQRGFKSITLFEQEAALLQRASYHNQARIHNGYHYPRSFTTAYRSRINQPRFLEDWPESVVENFTKLYAIARRNSKVTAKQFERFCLRINAAIEPAGASLKALFNPNLIEEVFLVEERAFDSTQLARWAHRQLFDAGIKLRLGSRVMSLKRSGAQLIEVAVDMGQGQIEHCQSKYVFNCTYSGLNQFMGDFTGLINSELKHEVTEIALVEPPQHLADLGITLMDGPFFSFMPFPARKLHSLTHVRYTPHYHWKDGSGIDPYLKLRQYRGVSNWERMQRDVIRYLPDFSQAKYVDSLHEIKTILIKNETDDGRPILMEKHAELPGCYSILGGKIDNIYDIVEKLDGEALSPLEENAKK